jgi:hypothetical protein
MRYLCSAVLCLLPRSCSSSGSSSAGACARVYGAMVERVLSGLPDESAKSEVRHAVLSGCDGPLRTTLAEAIKSGEARKFRRLVAAPPLCLAAGRRPI